MKIVCSFLVLWTSTAVHAQAKKPRAARSVHLWYRAPEAKFFMNAVTVEESQNGSYFMVCGFRHAYFGLKQFRSTDDKVILF